MQRVAGPAYNNFVDQGQWTNHHALSCRTE